ncbi:hypothetical protein [Dactylosporangium sp. NPDC005555]|uniref:hypothetical protein n=1 Tax=Dactylosporangium sp. NPDC005555 TaxID=3154889 RepID=UPI0033BB3687
MQYIFDISNLLSEDTPSDRAGNVLKVLLVIVAVIAAIGAVIFAQWMAEDLVSKAWGWPLWLMGGVGLIAAIFGYVSGSELALYGGGTMIVVAVGMAWVGGGL